jgi:hypothetical protein
LASISPWNLPLGLICPPELKTVKTTRFNYLRVFAPRVLYETGPGQVLDRRCESGLAAFTKVKQEV